MSEPARDLVAEYRAARARTRTLFEIPIEAAYYDRPIALRNPIVFYEGHLPAFAVNTLVKLARRERGVDDALEVLFERGIDPEDETNVSSAGAWPRRDEVRAYAAAADALVERALRDFDRDDPMQNEAAHAVVEHELMHQETFIYMLHNLPYDRKRRPRETFAREAEKSAGEDTGAPNVARIEAGYATLGADGSRFGWDNEFPEHRVAVDAFTIDRFNVTNRDYLAYVDATGASPPHFWVRHEREWFWRGMFELIPLPLDWPVYATHDEATAYAEWNGGRLSSEAEYHRAAFGTPSGDERRFPWGDDAPDASRGNFGLVSWEPDRAGSHPAGASAWGVHDLIGNGWEWTDTPFAGFPGFRPMPTYSRYSVDFFDGRHFVLKGASPATAPELIRRSFRNWFRPNYPFVYATFRCVR